MKKGNKENKVVEELKLYITRVKRACRLQSINRVFKEAEEERERSRHEEKTKDEEQSE